MKRSLKGRWRSLGMVATGRFYEELPLGLKIMVSHSSAQWSPPTDVFECDKVFVIKVAISGLKRAPNGEIENAELFVEDDTIIIRGNRVDECPHKKCTFYQMEIHYGPFESRIRIGLPFQHDAVRAEYRDGFLEVIVPKAEHPDSGSRPIRVRT